jgi:predicted nucleic acid-binding protein
VIIFDSTYLVVFLNPNPPAAKDRNDKPVEKFKERVEHLAAKFDASSEPIGIPAPAMAEVLVRAGKGRSKLVSILSDRWRFQILPFDSRAAIEAAELIAQIKTSGERWETWAKVKFDIQIVSIAKAENATVIYADDKDIENYAKRLKIPVVRICDLPLPLSPVEVGTVETIVGSQGVLNLATSDTKAEPEQVEVKHDAAEAGTAEKSDKLQADPAHPAPVQGSDGGRTESEAAREGEKESTKEVTPRPCECGCGEYPKDPRSRFLPGHDLRKAYNDQKQL